MLREWMDEVLLTNLPTEKFSTEQLAELYHMRCSVETVYEMLKSISIKWQLIRGLVSVS